MLDRSTDYPTAVASYADEGVDAAIDWCCEHLEDGDTLTVWTSLKSNLQDCLRLEQLVVQHSNVEHVTRRGGAFVRGNGPVLMAWAGMDDIGDLIQFNNHKIRALCIITGDEDAIRPWVSAVRPAILVDASAWEDLTPDLDPVVVEAMKDLIQMVNRGNTISAGTDKEIVVSILLALHDAGVSMDGEMMQGWALANGWSGTNPAHLARYVEGINAGGRPRSNRVIRADYVDQLRRQVANGE